MRTKVLFAALMTSFSGIAQDRPRQLQAELDSLYSVYDDKSNTDSVRFGALFTYVEKGFSLSQPDSCLYFYRKLYHEANEVGRKPSMARALVEQATSHSKLGRLDSAAILYEDGIRIYDQLGDRRSVVAAKANLANVYRLRGDLYEAYEAYMAGLDWFEGEGDLQAEAFLNMNVGNVLVLLGEHERALPRLERVLEISREMDNELIEAMAYDAIGNLHSHNNEWEKALEYYLKALPVYTKVGDKRNVARALANIGNRYTELNDPEKGLDFHERSLAVAREIGDKVREAVTLMDIGLTYSGLGEHDRALEFSNGSLSILMPLNLQEYLPEVLLQRSKVYIALDRNEDAIADCEMALNMAKGSGSIRSQRSACYCLYGEFEKKGNYEQALNYHVQLMALDDSLHNDDTVKKLQQVEFNDMQYADSLIQVEKDIQLQLAHQEEVAKKDKIRNTLLGGGSILLMIAVGLYSRNRYMSRSKKAIQEEKDRSDALLLNILPEEVADELKAKGEAEAKLIDQVTVLFTDFKGFTALSETLSPKELVRDLHECFSAFDNICEKYGLEKIKTIGDAYMAAGGLPTPNTTHATDVIQAALEMRDFIVEGKARKITAGKPYFEIRIGIHTGPVVAGIVGVKKFSYDIWGDTVNTASRMESSGEVGQVNISEATYELVMNEPGLTFTPRGKVQAKGKGELEMYFVSRA